MRYAPHPFLGKTVDGRYLLDRFLGGGASGRVYRAEDIKLNRPFALKILEFSGSDDSSSSPLRRFENEVEALSRIRNPHVINIYESLLFDEETPGMLTEYVEGETLRQMLGSDRLIEVESAMVLLHQIANGLHEAHTRGVIHRDIKPANIMVEQLPAAGSFARILDFGLVHIADDGGETRGFWGTPLYAAPEQCSGRGDITARTDIYSLGSVLFHCVAGRPPFMRDDARAIMHAQVNEEPPSLARVAEQPVPAPLDALVQRMLQKDPADRPEDMTHVIEGIDDLLGSGGRWDGSVVAEDSLKLTESADPASSLVVGFESEADTEVDGTGTRIGVADTAPSAPRLAQLLQSVDASAISDDFSGSIEATTLNPNGDCAVFADSENRIFVMSVKGDGYFQGLAPADVKVSALSADVSSGRIIGTEQNGRILRWRLDAPQRAPETIATHRKCIFALDVDRRGQQLYVGTEDGEVIRRDLRLGNTKTICSVSSTVSQLNVADGGRWVLAATVSGSIYAIDSRGGNHNMIQLDSIDTEPVSLELDARSGVAVAVDKESSLRIFNIRQSFGSATLEPAVDDIRTVTITPDRQIFALSVQEPDVRVWRIRQEKVEKKVPGVGNKEGRKRRFSKG